MPVWIVESLKNLRSVSELRVRAEGARLSDFTTFKPMYLSANPVDLSPLLDVLDLHHPYLTRLNIMCSEGFLDHTRGLTQAGYSSTREMWPDTIAFKRPLPAAIEVPELHLQAAEWKTIDDVFDSLFAAVGAPSWHGRNFDALNDSIVTGNINTVEVPYRLMIDNLQHATPTAQSFAKELIELIREFEALGCPVSIEESIVKREPQNLKNNLPANPQHRR